MESTVTRTLSNEHALELIAEASGCLMFLQAGTGEYGTRVWLRVDGRQVNGGLSGDRVEWDNNRDHPKKAKRGSTGAAVRGDLPGWSTVQESEVPQEVLARFASVRPRGPAGVL